MATPRNSVERRSRVADDAQDGLFLQRFWLKLVPFGTDHGIPETKKEELPMALNDPRA